MAQDSKQELSGFFTQKPHILLAEDDDRIRELTTRFLTGKGYAVIGAKDGQEALEFARTFSIDACVLDVMMPEYTGLDVAVILRRNNFTIPILFLSALSETPDRIAGFENGGDDYLVKPFAPEELHLRLQSLLRRRQNMFTRAPLRIRFGNRIVHLQTGEITDNGETCAKLTEAELTLLLLFLKKGDNIITRDDVMAPASHSEAIVGERTVDVQITRLRRKIEVDQKLPRYIQTVRGQGYSLRMDEMLYD